MALEQEKAKAMANSEELQQKLLEAQSQLALLPSIDECNYFKRADLVKSDAQQATFTECLLLIQHQ